MINQREVSLLEQLEAAGCGIDVDAGDPEVARSLPFKPHDMTSNQILVHERIMAPENKELVEKTIREMKGADWLDIHITLVSIADLSSRLVEADLRPPDSTPSSSPTSRAESSLKCRPETPTTRQRSSSMPASTETLTTPRACRSE